MCLACLRVPTVVTKLLPNAFLRFVSIALWDCQTDRATQNCKAGCIDGFVGDNCDKICAEF